MRARSRRGGRAALRARSSRRRARDRIAAELSQRAEREGASRRHQLPELSAQALQELVQSSMQRDSSSAESPLSSVGGLQGLLSALRSSATNGIEASETDMSNRRELYGTNEVAKRSEQSFLNIVKDAANDSTLWILCSSGAISLVLGALFENDSSNGWLEGASILGAVVIIVGVTAANNYQKEREFASLNEESDAALAVRAIRGSSELSLPTRSLVVGDVVLCEGGDVIPADGVLLEGDGFRVDESALTGESDELRKSPTGDPVLLSGSKVMEGSGRMLVVAVGERSQQGIVTRLIRERSDESVDSEQTPLQGKLAKLAEQIGYFGFAAGAACTVGAAIDFTYTTFVTNGASWDISYLAQYVRFLINGTAIVVVAVPEGLPLAVTLALAVSVQRMLADRNLVRYLSACETMGCATHILSDKTGTLTENDMQVVCGSVAGLSFDTQSTDHGSAFDELTQPLARMVAESASLNSTASLNGDDAIGSRTEAAMLYMSRALGFEPSGVRACSSDIERASPFTSDKRRMSSLYKTAEGFRLYVKGAPEVVLDMCQSQIASDGTIMVRIVSSSPFVKITTISTLVTLRNLKEFVQNMSMDQRKRLRSEVDRMAANGYRTLCLAQRDFTASNGSVDPLTADFEQELESDLAVLGVFGLDDPIRAQVPTSINNCSRAGINVMMVTGDNKLTATSIARRCGILNGDGAESIVEGPDFRRLILDESGELNQEAFNQIVDKVSVLARSTPQDKYYLVRGLRAAPSASGSDSNVVAVTGDGTNDAPALKRADVGFAMGSTGTSVAKDAADILLLDDKFNSITSAVRWGRHVYTSVSMFLQMQLTVNCSAVALACVGTLVNQESPLTAVQMLWVNFIMDTLAGLAFAYEEPTEQVLLQAPYSTSASPVSRTMLRNIVSQSALQLSILFGLLWKGDVLFGVQNGRGQLMAGAGANEHYTIVFNTFVLMQIFNQINSRKINDEPDVLKGVLSNQSFLAITGIELATQIAIVQFGDGIFQTVPLGAGEWAACTGFGALSLLLRRALVSLELSYSEA